MLRRAAAGGALCAVAAAAWSPGFTIDAGARDVDGATIYNTGACHVGAGDGKVWLRYQATSQNPGGFGMTLVTSAKGLSFSGAKDVAHEGGSGPYDDRCRALPDGKTMRCYHWPHNGGSDVTSVSSTDGGQTYTPDSGVRYTVPSEDMPVGITDMFTVGSDVYLTYIQGMGQGESVAIARSTDGGETFAKVGSDIFPHGAWPHDDDEVDQTVLPMSDGTLRYFVMVPGAHRAPNPGAVPCCNVTSYSLPRGGDPAKDWTWDGYTIDPSVEQLVMGGTSYPIWSLNDPHAVELPDGRVRVYVNALINSPPPGGSGDGNSRPLISFTSAAAGPAPPPTPAPPATPAPPPPPATPAPVSPPPPPPAGGQWICLNNTRTCRQNSPGRWPSEAACNSFCQG